MMSPIAKLPDVAKLPAKVAVLLAKDAGAAADGRPGDWPMRMEDRTTMATLPPGWQEMTAAQYMAHLNTHKVAAQAWIDTIPHDLDAATYGQGTAG